MRPVRRPARQHSADQRPGVSQRRPAEQARRPQPGARLVAGRRERVLDLGQAPAEPPLSVPIEAGAGRPEPKAEERHADPDGASAGRLTLDRETSLSFEQTRREALDRLQLGAAVADEEQVVSLATASSRGPIAALSAWWTTRSRNGAAEMVRGFGSATMKVRKGPGRHVPPSSSRSRAKSSVSRSTKKAALARERCLPRRAPRAASRSARKDTTSVSVGAAVDRGRTRGWR
jgi:hypothetical protein